MRILLFVAIMNVIYFHDVKQVLVWGLVKRDIGLFERTCRPYMSGLKPISVTN